MPTPEIVPGAPCWVDLMTADIEQAKSFYAEIFGWTYETGDTELYGGYTQAFKDGKTVAGLMQKGPEQAELPDVWTTYLNSADIGATTTAVEAAGGQVYLPPMEVPEQGHMAMYGDPSGGAIGVWQSGNHVGYQLTAEPGAPTWHELHSRDYEAAVTFYQKAFGWQTSVMSDTPEFRYTTLGDGEAAKAGIMDASGYLPEGVPSNWQTYFEIRDTDAVLEKAVSLGATVIDGPEDSPFGRLASLTDPTGALFKVVDSSKAVQE